MSTEAPGLRSDTAATRLRILRAAEAAYSEGGIEGVSLQEVCRAAGQRNKSAVTYHFGDKAGLLQAILGRHQPRVAERLVSRLDTLERAGRQHDLRCLAEALVLPMVEEAEEPDGGLAFVRISAQLMGHPVYSHLFFGNWAAQVPGALRWARLLAEAGPEVPPAYVRARVLLMAGLLLHGISDWSSAAEALDPELRRPEWSAVKESLVDSIAAVLASHPWERASACSE